MRSAETACPRCHARLDLDTLRETGAQSCPFCETDVSALLNQWQGEEPIGRMEGGAGDSRTAADQTGGAVLVRPLPPGSGLQVVQSGSGRLVLFIPPGGIGGKSLWGFAIFFTAVLTFITGVFVMILVSGPAQKQESPAVMLPVLGIFWLIALGVWWGAVRMRYSRTLLSVDAERVVLQTTVFGKSRQDELLVGSDTECSLSEAYSVNDVPVYRIQVSSPDKNLGFGTNLSPDDKDWLVDQIESIIRSSSTAGLEGGDDESGPDTAMLLEGAGRERPVHYATQEVRPSAVPLSPGELPGDSPIQVEDDRPDLLQFTFPALQNATARRAIPAVILAFMGVWLFSVGSFAWMMWNQGGPFAGLFLFVPLLMLAFGTLPLFAALSALWGRTTVRLTPEVLECLWAIGPLRYRRSMAVEQIETILLGGLKAQRRVPTGRAARRLEQRRDAGGCAVTGGGKLLLVAPFSEPGMSRQLAGLLLWRLAGWGRSPDVQLGEPRHDFDD